MFPVKGTTVWVNFKDKSYLGKVLQTSPELDMVCVRISNYLDHVSRNDPEMIAHSCPTSNPSMLTNRQSSVVITCGLADICSVGSNNNPHFSKKHSESESQNIEDSSENIIDSNPIKIFPKSNSREASSDNLQKLCFQNFSTNEDDCDWSESFGINKLLRKSQSDSNRSLSVRDKYWQCLHCHIYLSNESDMNLHVINRHKLDFFLDKDNWIIVGGIPGLDYDEVKAPEDINIRDLNNIHISSGSRKRQFFESVSEVNRKFSNSDRWKNQLYHHSARDFHQSERSQNGFVNNIQEFRPHEMYWSNISELLNNSNNEYDYLRMNANSSSNNLPIQNFPDNSNDYERKFQIFQNMILQHHLHSSLSVSLNESSRFDELPIRYRSHSISDQLLPNTTQWNCNSFSELSENSHMSSTPTKKSKLEVGVKKCRKMYGIDHRDLWCNQCKWKKACSRFSSEIN